MSRRREPALLALSAALGAFLLFLVQPLVARRLLPEFGGAPAVWTASMLFFQAALLGGYAYAHGLVRRLGRRSQGRVHTVLLAAALGYSVCALADGAAPGDGAGGALGVLLAATALVGLPFFALASTAPLVQAWFAGSGRDEQAYRLYSLSNAGSLAALIAYPFAVEPHIGLAAQSTLWTGLFAAFCLAMGWAALTGRPDARSRPDAPTDGSPTHPADRVLWPGLPFAASTLLLAITNELTQNVAVTPFLWVAPLALYLLSFVIAFGGGYRPTLFRPLALLCILLLGRTSWSQFGGEFTLDIVLWSAALFVLCVACHGELYLRRPATSRMTAYYLAIAAGGAGGGLFVGLIAPLVFSAFSELWIGLFGSVALVGASIATAPTGTRRHWHGLGYVAAAAAIGVVLLSVREEGEVVDRRRGFFGVFEVADYDVDGPDAVRHLSHGAVVHGSQLTNGLFRLKPVAYYGHGTPVEAVFRTLRKRRGRRIGAVGLGVGTIAAYGEEGDTIRFYEIDPDAELVAREHFTFLADSVATIQVVIGDGRRSLEREPDQAFDVLVVDAFSGATPPSHLLTLEAFAVYERHLAPGGVLLVHVSNAHVDLVPVAWSAAERLGMQRALLENDDLPGHETYASSWVAMTRDLAFLRNASIRDLEHVAGDTSEEDLWTDDRSSLLRHWQW